MGPLIINLVGVGGTGFWARDEFWGRISRFRSVLLISHSINCLVYPNPAFINDLKFT